VTEGALGHYEVQWGIIKALMLAGVVNDWRLSMEILTATLAVSVVLSLAGGCLKGKDYRPEGERGLPSAQKVQQGGLCLVTFAGH